MSKRFVRKSQGARFDPAMQCRYCLTCWGGYKDRQNERACPPSTCLLCGARQCLGNGLSNGQCSICFHGLLPGWSGSNEGQPCTYKGCTGHAVARGRGQKLICAAHAAHQKLGTQHTEGWKEVEEAC